MAVCALDRLRRAGAVDAVIFLGQVDPDDADRTVGAWRDALLVLLVGHIPEELGLEMEGRIIGDAGHPPVAQRQRIVRASHGGGELGEKPIALSIKAKDAVGLVDHDPLGLRSEEHTSELQSLMRIAYAVLCLKKKN